MPYYPPVVAASTPINIVSYVPGAYTAAPAGAKILATCPRGRAWEVRSIWIENPDLTKTFALTLIQKPFGWIGSLYDTHLRICTSFEVQPQQDALLPHAFIGFRGGDELWGYQQELPSGAASALHVLIGGVET